MSEVPESFNHTAVLHKKRERDKLQSDVDAFVAKGGKIRQCAPNESSGASEQEIRGYRRGRRPLQHKPAAEEDE